ncbi:ABC transporter permease [Pseudogemmobacter blasticus]|uniref:ABC transporter permease n=1 Tax=Fuscovulum blasticum DSM 2131 TaxID=1188250 RepID=A0A2T4JBT3_FUSBL|nr:ABC transporter permease subunit [Fuscovulum blasticum]PTE15375.1 ABC transporter permease [Fuscovulum blasticum DSM 2131]
MKTWPLIWAGLAVVALVLARAVAVPDGWLWPPQAMHLPLARWISAGMAWLTDSAAIGPVTVKDLTRGFARLIEAPYEAARVLLVEGITEGRGRRATTIVPPLSWVAVTVAAVALGHYARDIWLGLIAGALMLYLAVFGQWDSAMITLASIVIAVPLGVAGGLGLGIAALHWRPFERVLSPVLDLMQTVPTFAYLVPVLVLFGFGPVAALLATVIYAMPPMVRVTLVALRGVPPEIVDFANMAGCTPGQRMRKVMLPVALPDLMVGVNQVIMLSLNMVIIASMIGAGGLGADVLESLRRLNIGGGIEAGLAITALAVVLDRLGQALATRAGGGRGAKGNWLRRHPRTVLVLAVTLISAAAGYLIPAVQDWPKEWTVTTKGFWADLMQWINVNYYDQLEALRNWTLVNLLIPVKDFLLALPWPFVLGTVALAGWALGGWRLAALTGALGLFLAATGLWEQAMITLYLCGVSVLIAMCIGVPLGIWAASGETAGKVIGAVIDTLQTLPSFVYLIPVVMLFRVGDFSAMIAVVLYALVPAVRYTAHGLRSVPEELIEAGIVSGATRGQILRKIRLPMAVPMMLLGLNQTILLALSMLVITALVGTRDLGQEVYIALTKADVGRGLVAGLSVAAIAIIADRLIGAAAKGARERLEGGA